jgi:hypothetical protein
MYITHLRKTACARLTIIVIAIDALYSTHDKKNTFPLNVKAFFMLCYCSKMSFYSFFKPLFHIKYCHQFNKFDNKKLSDYLPTYIVVETRKPLKDVIIPHHIFHSDFDGVVGNGKCSTYILTTESNSPPSLPPSLLPKNSNRCSHRIKVFYSLVHSFIKTLWM